MKKLFALFLAGLMAVSSYATAPLTDVVQPVNAHNIMIPVGKTGTKISLADFSHLKAAEYEKLANVKLNFIDRIKYNRAMKKLRNSIAADGTITNKKLIAGIKTSTTDFTEDFHLGGAALGVLLGPIGVLIAYLIEDGNQSVRIKWAWIGFAVWFVFALLIF